MTVPIRHDPTALTMLGVSGIFISTRHRIVRSHLRRKCPQCGRKRALYAVASWPAGGEMSLDSLTGFYCADCWGVRSHG